jgi:two-component system, chemotaxis family, protein-glutamate methylesterase/glutaminase
MQKIRVLVVDDSVVIRRVVSEEINSASGLEVAGTAANGKIALDKMSQVNPDLVILDVEMPVLDGLETLAAIRKTHPRVPIIMFSSLTERGASETLDALALGATDYFPKPSSSNLDETRETLRRQLIPAIQSICKPKPLSTLVAKPQPTSPVVTPKFTMANRVDAVVLAVSTGGPNALADLFATLPGNLPVPIFLVQHMPPMFTKQLANRLTATTQVRVEEAATGIVPTPGNAYIAPGDFHMVLAKDGTQVRVMLTKEPHENSCRPAADPLFRSAVAVYGKHLLAVVLTGMGQDGLRGCEAVKSAGGQILAQDEATSVVWGMPGFVVKAGLADRVLPITAIGPEIIRRLAVRG